MTINILKYFILLLFLSSMVLMSCGDDDTPEPIFDYSIDIASPNSDAKMVGDMLPIRIEFKSGTEMTIHNINVRIYNVSDTGIVAYNETHDRLVHQDGGSYIYEDMIILSHEIGFHTHGDWILEARVSGQNGAEEQVEQVTFHVHPSEETDFAYHAHIKMPMADIIGLGTTLPIQVEFESHTGQPIHHVSVKIVNKADKENVAYNLPVESHVHDISGEYEYIDQLDLPENNFPSNSEWILEAAVWGPEGAGLVSEEKEFKIGS